MKSFLLFDHDDVLVDTGMSYFRAAERVSADVGVTLDQDTYIRDLNLGLGSWVQATAAGPDEATLERLRMVRNEYCREYLRSELIEIDGVVEALSELSPHARMGIATTAKPEDFDLIHENRSICRFMDFVVVREDYERGKPDPEPYLTGLRRSSFTGEQALVVEDSARGLKSALAAGIDCAVVYNEFTRSSDSSGASDEIGALIELKDIILRPAS